MAEAIVACDGAGNEWDVREDGPTCPSCELTAKDLEIKVRKTSKGLVPSTIPNHEIIVEGTELRFATFDSEYRVHAPDCAGLKRDLTESGQKRAGVLVAADRSDAIDQLWAEEDPEDPDKTVLPDGAAEATKFHARCVNRLDGFAPSKAAKTGSAKRDSKRELATLVIEAIAKVVANLPADSPVFEGLSADEIGKIVPNWVHHLPADRERWVASGLPTPDRSDWRTDEASPAESAEPDNEDESDE